jgi:hypothetical protein
MKDVCFVGFLHFSCFYYSVYFSQKKPSSSYLSIFSFIFSCKYFGFDQFLAKSFLNSLQILLKIPCKVSWIIPHNSLLFILASPNQNTSVWPKLICPRSLTLGLTDPSRLGATDLNTPGTISWQDFIFYPFQLHSMILYPLMHALYS